VPQAAVHGIVCSRRLQNGMIVQKNVAQRFSLFPLSLSDMLSLAFVVLDGTSFFSVRVFFSAHTN